MLLINCNKKALTLVESLENDIGNCWGALSVGITPKKLQRMKYNNLHKDLVLVIFFEYEAFNSAKIIGGKMRKQKTTTREKQQKFISTAQLSALVTKKNGTNNA